MLQSATAEYDEETGLYTFDLQPIGAAPSRLQFTIRLENLASGTYSLVPDERSGFEVTDITSQSVNVTVTDLEAFNTGPQHFEIQQDQGIGYWFFI